MKIDWNKIKKIWKPEKKIAKVNFFQDQVEKENKDISDLGQTFASLELIILGGAREVSEESLMKTISEMESDDDSLGKVFGTPSKENILILRAAEYYSSVAKTLHEEMEKAINEGMEKTKKSKKSKFPKGMPDFMKAMLGGDDNEEEFKASFKRCRNTHSEQFSRGAFCKQVSKLLNVLFWMRVTEEYAMWGTDGTTLKTRDGEILVIEHKENINNFNS